MKKPFQDMKVAIDGRRLKKNSGGVGHYVYRLVDILSKKIECMVFVGDKNDLPEFENPERIDFVTVPGNVPVSIKRFNVENKLFTKILRQKKVDLYHGMDSMGVPNVDIPKVITVHDLIPLVLGEYLDFFTKIIYKYSIKRSVKKADHIICVSEFTMNELNKLLNVPKEKMTVISNGYYVADFSEVKKEDLNIKLPRKYIVYVGSLGPRKNIPNMLKAYKLFLEDKLDAPDLVIIGEFKPILKKEIQGYMNLIDSLGIKEKVIFTGTVSDSHLAFIRSRALFALYVSNYEGFGLPIVGAMYQGIPMITSNVTAMPDVAEDGALLVDPSDVKEMARNMELLYTDANVRKRLIKRGKQICRKYTWEKIAEQILGLYNVLLSSFSN